MMLLSSLRGRIFLASALLAVVAIGVAIYVVNVRVTQEAERTLEQDIVSTATLVDQLRTTNAQTYTEMARFIADAPKMKAAVDTNDPPTVQDIANGYQQQLRSNVLLVTNRAGSVLATVGAASRATLVAASRPAIDAALAGREQVSLLPEANGILQLITVPITIGLNPPEILGTLSLGLMLDDAIAAQLKQITGSDIAFGMNGRVLAGTLPPESHGVLGEQLHTAGVSRVAVGRQEFLALPLSLTSAAAVDGPVALILRSRTEQLRFLDTIRAGLAVTAVLAVIVATLLSFAVARTITRPLAAITDVMREVAASGDLTRKIPLRPPSRWEDEDARLLATTFNTLTDSIARFQREMSQKERLTALGRLSTVIAHEIRNPLMIVKASLRVLKQPDAAPSAVHEAVADIDEELVRLNRVVNEVLDFARPIRFELAPVDVNQLCREAAAAAEKSAPGATIHLEPAAALPQMTTDAERLRVALVNVLVNACHAADGRASEGVAPDVALRTESHGTRVVITVRDRGPGINAADVAHVFDPYFTTRRGGTGLGLPIAKNIVEGLGGVITVSSVIGEGTVVSVDVPLQGPA
jgi:signal transduction histidine kinase